MKDIAISILVLLCCAILTLYGMVYLNMRNPSQYLSDYLIATLDQNGSYSFRMTGLRRTFLKDLTVINPSIEKEGTVIASAEEGTVAGGIPLLVQSVLHGNQKISLQLKKLNINLSDSSMLPQTNDANALLSNRWLNTNTVSIQSNAMEGSFHTSSFQTEVSNAAFFVELAKGSTLPTVQVKANRLQLQSEMGTLYLDDASINLNNSGAVSLATASVSLESAGLKGSAEDLVVLGNLDGFNLPKDLGAFSLSASTFQAQLPDLSISIPEFSSSISFEKGTMKQATLSFDQMMLTAKGMSLYAPTTTLQGTWNEGIFSLGAATKQGEALTYILQDSLSLTSDNLLLNARYKTQEQDVEASLSLNQVRYYNEDLSANLDTISISGDAHLEGTQLGTASLLLEAQSALSLDSLDLEAVSPLTASLYYERERSALSASLTFEALDSSFTDGPLYSRLSYQANAEGRQLQAELNLDDRLSLVSVYDLLHESSGSLHMSARMNEFPLSFIHPTLMRYAPFLQPYYQEGTNLIGNVTFQSQTGHGNIMPFDGTLAIDLALRDAKIGGSELDAGFTFNGKVEQDVLDVEAMTVATSGYRLVYTGKTNLSDWLPSGRLDLFRSDDGQLLGSVNFSEEPPKRYRFMITTPFEQSFVIDGIIGASPQNMLMGEARLNIFEAQYPFTFQLQTNTLQLSITQGNVFSLSTNLAPPITAKIATDGLILPNRGFFANAQIAGDLTFLFNDLRNWNITSDSLIIRDVGFQGHTYAMSTSLDISQQQLSLPEILLSDEEGNQFVGSLSYAGADFLSLAERSFLAPFTSSFTLHANNQRKIAISLIGSDERISGVFKISDFPLNRFFPFADNAIVDLDILGYTDLQQILSADGQLQINLGEGTFSTKIEAKNESLQFFASRFEQGDFAYDGNILLISGDKAISEGVLSHVRHLSYMDQQSSLSYNLSIDLENMESLFDIRSVIKPMLQGNVKGVLSLSDIKLLDEGGISDGVYSFSLDYPSLTVESDLLSFNYDVASQDIEGTAEPDFGIGFSLQGSLADENFGLIIEDIYFPLNLLNRTFLKPIFSFLDGTVRGEVFLGWRKDAIRPYGQVSVDSSRMQLFWLPQDVITMKNVTATLDGTSATTPRIPFFSTNTITGKTVEGYGTLGANFDGLRLQNYEIHADSGNEMLYVWIPMQGFDVDIRTYAGGTFDLFGIGFETWLSGAVTIQDTTISLGIKDLPYWYVANNLTSTDFSVVTGRNVSFFYPNTPNPFIQATITENQEINFSYDHITDEFIIDGNLAFRSGEFYYFQKNFFITEGSLSLHTDALSGQNTIQPTINLRAKLTDFDAQGDRVDIFLVLRESSLTNLNPQFESTPPKDVNEILEILGQSILPTGAYGQVNLYSVASLAAAATDVAERLGYLQTSQSTLLTESIRLSLGLDMFSIRSNILQNILIDALPGSSMANLSPLARYLNNTTIFMGKYVGEQFFLQALLHLTATDGTQVTRSFISPDLSIDLELSLDWQNPIGTFSFFTQPNELSFINILDTIGFSVTRRFVLR
ncbi:MAG: hypothetical protein ACQ5SW_11725 [Sphaerochaetaceae bacterium]